MKHLEQLLYMHGHPPVNYFPFAYSVEKKKTEDEKEIISLNVYL